MGKLFCKMNGVQELKFMKGESVEVSMRIFDLASKKPFPVDSATVYFKKGNDRLLAVEANVVEGSNGEESTFSLTPEQTETLPTGSEQDLLIKCVVGQAVRYCEFKDSLTVENRLFSDLQVES